MVTFAMTPCSAFASAACVVALGASCAFARAQIAAESNPPTATAHDVSLDEYRQHLESLTAVVQACAKARDMKTCDPMLVGLDDRVPIEANSSSTRRLIRYDWLRATLARAQEKNEPPPKPAAPSALPGLAGAPSKQTTPELLAASEARLAADLAKSSAPYAAPPDHAPERAALAKVLAGREFRDIGATSPREELMERVDNAINSFFNRIARFSARNRWLGRVAVWGFFAAICVGLTWGLIQLERRWRIRLVPAQDGPAPDAPSARDWQLWLEDARRAAAEGRWREAIHLLYWAAISRLESNRLWPADRARTPREYLALVAEEDPRRPPLATLTGSFERTWYGGRAAHESDYRAAEQLASALISSRGGAA
jgi:hypothetical protein